MYREVSQLLLYSNLGEDSILRQLSGIFSDWAHGECEKPVLVSRIYQQVKRLLGFSDALRLQLQSVARLPDVRADDEREQLLADL